MIDDEEWHKEQAQMNALLRLNEGLSKYRANSVIARDQGGILCLRAWHPDHGSGQYEICSQGDKYDAWVNGSVAAEGMDVEEATRLAALDYCHLKAKTVAQRWLSESGGDFFDVYKDALDVVCGHHGLSGARA